MKKMIITIAVAFITLGAFAAGDNVSPRVLDAFKSDFTTARQAEWSVATDYYKVTFVYNEQHVFAYYNEEGELLGLTRYLSPLDMPLNLQTNLKKNYSGYWISDLFEVAKNNGTAYYITLENADTKLVLKSSDEKTWSQYEKIKKS